MARPSVVAKLVVRLGDIDRALMIEVMSSAKASGGTMMPPPTWLVAFHVAWTRHAVRSPRARSRHLCWGRRAARPT